jgi:predicted alpha/beta-fold hydrolase
MCNPFNLVTCDVALESGMVRRPVYYCGHVAPMEHSDSRAFPQGRVYSKSMGDGLRRIFAPHAALFAGLPRFDAAGALVCRTVREFDEAITRRTFGFASVDDYYRASGSAARLPSVMVPLLCVQAKDDPIAVDAAVPREAAAANPNVALVVTPSGGHLGWITVEGGATGAPGPDQGVLEWFAAAEAEWVAARSDAAASRGQEGRAMASAGRG